MATRKTSKKAAKKSSKAVKKSAKKSTKKAAKKSSKRTATKSKKPTSNKKTVKVENVQTLNVSQLNVDKSYSSGMSIAGLILNAFFWPGLGTIINGDTQKGIIQMVLTLVSLPLMIIIVGIPLLIGTWIWALVTSIEQIRNSN